MVTVKTSPTVAVVWDGANVIVTFVVTFVAALAGRDTPGARIANPLARRIRNNASQPANRRFVPVGTVLEIATGDWGLGIGDWGSAAGNCGPPSVVGCRSSAVPVLKTAFNAETQRHRGAKKKRFLHFSAPLRLCGRIFLFFTGLIALSVT